MCHQICSSQQWETCNGAFDKITVRAVSVCATKIKPLVVNQNHYHAWQLKIFTNFFSAPKHYIIFTFKDSFTLKSLWFLNYIKQCCYFTVITFSKSIQAKISSSNSTFIKRYVNTS